MQDLLFAASTPLHYRARYYEATSGRFIAEDPVGFEAGSNFYRYVRNNPNIFIDPTGLNQVATLPPNPKLNTIVCNGHGGIKVQLGNTGTPEQTKCLGDCMQVHEESHIGDAVAASPKVCKGKADGVIVGFADKLLKASEIKATNAELDCLRNELEHGCKACGPTVLQRIMEQEGYRDSFKN